MFETKSRRSHCLLVHQVQDEIWHNPCHIADHGKAEELPSWQLGHGSAQHRSPATKDLQFQDSGLDNIRARALANMRSSDAAIAQLQDVPEDQSVLIGSLASCWDDDLVQLSLIEPSQSAPVPVCRSRAVLVHRC